MSKNRVTLHNKQFDIYISEEEILQINQSLAEQINPHYVDKVPIVLCILNGSFIFAADLVRHFDFNLKMEFVRYSSYEGTDSTGTVTKILGLKSDIKGQDIILIEDIVDTGLTLSKAIKDLWTQAPKSIKIVSLLLKPEALQYDIPVDFVGKSIPNKFVVGYGLDFDELGRDLPAIYQLAE
jgi:hypoxanthine phosphoribosyltransferase